jgi:hypothetical protein
MARFIKVDLARFAKITKVIMSDFRRELKKPAPDTGKLSSMARMICSYMSRSGLCHMEAMEDMDVSAAAKCFEEAAFFAKYAASTISMLRVTPTNASKAIRKLVKGEHPADARSLIDLAALIDAGAIKSAYKHFNSMDTFVRDCVPQDVCDWLHEKGRSE